MLLAISETFEQNFLFLSLIDFLLIFVWYKVSGFCSSFKNNLVEIFKAITWEFSKELSLWRSELTEMPILYLVK